jgi:hypothetical protein
VGVEQDAGTQHPDVGEQRAHHRHRCQPELWPGGVATEEDDEHDDEGGGGQANSPTVGRPRRCL